jgi:ubiquitin-conjugating enzyme E2 variant
MDNLAGTVRQQDAKDLAKHYTWKKQLLEACSVLVFTVLLLLMLFRLSQIDLRPHVWSLVASFLIAMVAADLASGLVHWLADTWGTVEFPILGPTLIKNFREHHSDPLALTRKGLIETNGDNCMVLCPTQLAVLFLPLDSPGLVFFYAFWVGLTFWIMLTNQIHKWAHMKPEQLSWPVRVLQRAHVFLPKSEHDIHHTIPFESHYCITNGWLNPILRKTGFYRGLEWIGWKVFGALPRENDIGTDAAVALAIRQGILPSDFRPVRQVVGTRSTPTAPVEAAVVREVDLETAE